MEDYPRNLSEFDSRFGTEEACREYLFQLRWPEGFRCRAVGAGRVRRLGQYFCGVENAGIRPR